MEDPGDLACLIVGERRAIGELTIAQRILLLEGKPIGRLRRREARTRAAAR